MTKEEIREQNENTILNAVFKVLLCILLVVVFFIVGVFIGYVVVGGGKYWEVFNIDTWQHIRDFIK